MLISVVGTPTPFAHWGFAAARKAAEFLFGDLHHIHARTLEGFKSGIAARGSRNVVFTSDQPPAEMGDLLIKLRTPVFAFQDDLSDTVRFLVELRAMAISEAITQAVECYAGLNSLEGSVQRLVFSKADIDSDAALILERCLRFLSSNVTGDQITTFCLHVLTNCVPGISSTVREQMMLTGWPPEYLPDTLSSRLPHRVSLEERLIEKYKTILSGRGDVIEVDREFLEFSKPYHSKTGVIDLAGPPRCLVSGPALHLPVGDWVAELEFEVSDNNSGNAVVFEIRNHDTVLAAAHTKLPPRGVFSCELRFTIIDGSLFNTLTMSMVGGAIEGQFILKSLVFRHLLDMSVNCLMPAAL